MDARSTNYGGPNAKRFKPNGVAPTASPYTPTPAQSRPAPGGRAGAPAAPPRSWPLIPDSDEPAPLYYPLATVGCQAKHTTFPSRLRLGTTSLVQPLFTADSISRKTAERARENSPTAFDAPGGGGSFGTPGIRGLGAETELGKRVRKVVNYAEIEARNEEVEESDDDSDDDASMRAGGATSRQRAMMAGMQRAARNASGTATPVGGQVSAAALAAKAEADRKQRELDAMKAKMFGDGKVYLGQRPPAKHVLVQRRDRRTTTVAPSIDDIEAAAEDFEGLIPIRVEFETETLKIRDRFVWNMNERYITPEVFAHAFCLDLDLPREPWMNRIAEQIKSQLEESSHIAEVQLMPDEEDVEADKLDGSVPDLRVIINLDVQLDQMHVLDRLEWDLSSPLTPELFASQYIVDLCLPPSCAPLVAHAIHEELLRNKRECLENGLVGGAISFARDVDGSIKRGPKRMEGIWREWVEASHFGPRVEELTLEEIEANELEKERAVKRAKRETIRPGFRRR